MRSSVDLFRIINFFRVRAYKRMFKDFHWLTYWSVNTCHEAIFYIVICLISDISNMRFRKY